MPTPTEIKYRKSERTLSVAFEDGTAYELPAEYLRVYSPSAEVRGHGGPMKVETGKEAVGIRGIEPVGNYAVRLIFDDGHDSGLYSWKLLEELGRDRERLWNEHLERVAAKGTL
ncbi:MAG: DUF971 domain-containing protein [Xanthomonadaceae bacterium]|nr:DUF971 domain-containing protein [Xanthomonadaceae bacterium]